MATLPGLVLKIGANTTDAIAGLNKVNRAVGQSATGADKMRASWRKAGPALGAAAAAAGALAVAIGTQAVRAAMEEEQSVARLSKTLENLGLATQSAGVEQFIDDMQFATGIADNDLRPAMDRLVRSTGDVGEAQRALAIASDIAVAKGRSVTEVANILGKAYDGNTMSLGRLGVGLDKDILKSGDMVAITAELARLFSGQAADAADTLAGRMAVLQIGIDELSESLGQGLITGFVGDMEDGKTSLEDMGNQLRNMQTSVENIGETLGAFAKGVVFAFDVVRGSIATAVYVTVQGYNRLYDAYIELADKLGWITDAEADHERATQAAIKAAQQQAYYEDLLGTEFGKTASSADDATSSTNAYATSLDRAETGAKRTTTALQRMQAQMDKMSTNRSIAGQRINLAQTRAEGPGKGDNLREFGLGYADQAARLASDIAERGNFSERSKRRARRVLSNAREYLGSLGLGSNFTDSDGAFLGTPNALRAGSRNSRAVGPGIAESQKMGTTVNIGVVNVNADTPEEAVEKAKRFARMSAAGRGLPMRGSGVSPQTAFGPGYGPFAPTGAPF